jgi:acetyl-CoA carboxylase carboxyl transferase subunit alpha
LLELKIIDEIVEEPLEGAHTDFETTAKRLKEAIAGNLKELVKVPVDKLVEDRYLKFRNMGIFTEKNKNENAV